MRYKLKLALLFLLLTVTLALGIGLGIWYHMITRKGHKIMLTIPTNQLSKNTQLSEDTQLITPSGSTFTGSKNWYVTTRDDMVILEEPDRELTIALVENKEVDAQKAIQAAWKKLNPDFDYPVAQTISAPATDGWDEIVQVIYETSAEESKLVFAVARRKAETWYIQVIDGTKGGLGRRSAQMAIVLTSFKPSGLTEESFADKTAHVLTPDSIQKLVEFIEEARKKCEIPGVAVGIVRNGQIVFEQGFGVRTLGQDTPVTPNTLFMIGSTTKSLTTFMMGKLVDEGKFGWDTPVSQLMPEFKLGNEVTTKQTFMKHLVSANTGMPRQDLEMFFNNEKATPEMRISEMATMQPTTGFGETFQYSNYMVAAGGYIAANSLDKKSSLGDAYDIAMQTRVFDPMGMASTTFDFEKVHCMDNASPHGRTLKHKYLSIDDESWITAVRPAGAAWSNVRDMSRYMITELNKGINPDGTRVISEANLLKRRESQTKITDKISYGLGLMIEDDHGVQVVTHGGNTIGFTSQMLFLPEHNVGLVILTNGGGANLFTGAVTRRFMELLFDGKPVAAEQLKCGIESQEASKLKVLEEVDFTPDTKWAKQFVGTYTNEALGSVTISIDGKEIIFDAGEWKTTMGQKKEKTGTLNLIFTRPPLAGLEFQPQPNGGLLLDMGQHKYLFARTD